MKKIILLAIVWCSLVPSLFAQEKEQIGSSYFQAVDEYKVGNYTKSIELIKSLLGDGKSSYEFYALLAFNYDKLNDFDNSYKNMLEARKLKVNDEDLLESSLGILAKYKKWKPSIELAEKAIPLFPTNPEIRYYYALALSERGASKTALSQIEKAKAGSPNDFRMLLLEGKIYYNLKNYDKADVSLRWASSIKDKSYEVWNNLALVQESMFYQHKKLGKKSSANSYLSEAKVFIQKASSLDDSNSTVKENSKRILSISEL
ncbi:CDC27 family protein [Leptospira sp. 96542]|nr:CDC27 family protein [Leptospira sp. 96542]